MSEPKPYEIISFEKQFAEKDIKKFFPWFDGTASRFTEKTGGIITSIEISFINVSEVNRRKSIAANVSIIVEGE